MHREANSALRAEFGDVVPLHAQHRLAVRPEPLVEERRVHAADTVVRHSVPHPETACRLGVVCVLTGVVRLRREARLDTPYVLKNLDSPTIN
jgi:hypothetical protein